MVSAHCSRNRIWPVALAVLGLVAMSLVGVGKADEVDAIGNPLVDETQIMLMYVSPSTSGFSYIFLEGWRQWGLALVDISRDQERQAMLAAITTHAILQIDKSVRTSAASCEIILEKLREDMAHYEDRFPDFRTRRSPPTDEDDLRYYNRYRTIKEVVDGPGAVVDRLFCHQGVGEIVAALDAGQGGGLDGHGAGAEPRPRRSPFHERRPRARHHDVELRRRAVIGIGRETPRPTRDKESDNAIPAAARANRVPHDLREPGPVCRQGQPDDTRRLLEAMGRVPRAIWGQRRDAVPGAGGQAADVRTESAAPTIRGPHVPGPRDCLGSPRQPRPVICRRREPAGGAP